MEWREGGGGGKYRGLRVGSSKLASSSSRAVREVQVEGYACGGV